MNSATAFRISAVVGFLGVALGAFGAHGLKEVLSRNTTESYWETATVYLLVHACVLLIISTRDPLAHWPWRLFTAGIAIFSGTLYLLAITNWRWLGALTPVGGLCLLAGWLSLAWRRPR
jgi:uncharacterized membrane protein YgdD (TMEM256/DUF423 family)